MTETDRSARRRRGAARPGASGADGRGCLEDAGRDYHHGALREASIAAAIEIVGEVGVEGLTLAEVARRVRRSPAAISPRHFRNKADLIGHIAADGFHQLHDACVRGVADCAPGSLEKLIALGNAYIGFVAGRPELYHVMWGALRERVDHHDAQECGRRGYYFFIDILEEVKAAQGLGDIATEELSAPLWAMVHGFANLLLGDNEHFDRDPARLRASVDMATRALFAGLPRP